MSKQASATWHTIRAYALVLVIGVGAVGRYSAGMGADGGPTPHTPAPFASRTRDSLMGGEWRISDKYTDRSTRRRPVDK